MAIRVAISRARTVERDNSRLATFAHAMSSTKLTAPMTVMNMGRPAPPTNLSVNVSTGTLSDILCCLGVLVDQLSRNSPHLRLRLDSLRTVFEPAEHADDARASILIRMCRLERHPEIRGIRKFQALWHHADDRDGLPVDAQGPPQHARIQPEPSLPDFVTDDNDRISAGELIPFDEIPAEVRLLTEHAEQVRSDPGCVGFLWESPLIADVDGRFRVSRKRVECPAAVAKIVELLMREVRAAAGPVLPRHDVEAIRAIERQSPKERRIHDREAGRIRPDAEGQRGESPRREPRILDDQPEREAEILKDRRESRAGRGRPGAALG